MTKSACAIHPLGFLARQDGPPRWQPIDGLLLEELLCIIGLGLSEQSQEVSHDSLSVLEYPNQRVVSFMSRRDACHMVSRRVGWRKAKSEALQAPRHSDEASAYLPGAVGLDCTWHNALELKV